MKALLKTNIKVFIYYNVDRKPMRAWYMTADGSVNNLVSDVDVLDHLGDILRAMGLTETKVTISPHDEMVVTYS